MELLPPLAVAFPLPPTDHLAYSVGTLDDGYVHKVPLPRAPQIQSPGHVTCAAVTKQVTSDTCYLQVSCIPSWSDVVRSQLGGARSMMIPLTHCWLI
jgi:hypothetical protein